MVLARASRREQPAGNNLPPLTEDYETKPVADRGGEASEKVIITPDTPESTARAVAEQRLGNLSASAEQTAVVASRDIAATTQKIAALGDQDAARESRSLGEKVKNVFAVFKRTLGALENKIFEIKPYTDAEKGKINEAFKNRVAEASQTEQQRFDSRIDKQNQAMLARLAKTDARSAREDKEMLAALENHVGPTADSEFNETDEAFFSKTISSNEEERPDEPLIPKELELTPAERTAAIRGDRAKPNPDSWTRLGDEVINRHDYQAAKATVKRNEAEFKKSLTYDERQALQGAGGRMMDKVKNLFRRDTFGKLSDTDKETMNELSRYQASQERDRKLANLYAEGKITPALRKHLDNLGLADSLKGFKNLSESGTPTMEIPDTWNRLTAADRAFVEALARMPVRADRLAMIRQRENSDQQPMTPELMAHLKTIGVVEWDHDQPNFQAAKQNRSEAKPANDRREVAIDKAGLMERHRAILGEMGNPYGRSDEDQGKFAWHAVFDELGSTPTEITLKTAAEALRQKWAQAEGVGIDYSASDERWKLQTGEALRQVIEAGGAKSAAESRGRKAA